MNQQNVIVLRIVSTVPQPIPLLDVQLQQNNTNSTFIVKLDEPKKFHFFTHQATGTCTHKTRSSGEIQRSVNIKLSYLLSAAPCCCGSCTRLFPQRDPDNWPSHWSSSTHNLRGSSWSFPVPRGTVRWWLGLGQKHLRIKRSTEWAP